MKLSELISNIKVRQIIGPVNREVTAVAFDSREIIHNAVFVAQRGVHADGHRFIQAAIQKGAGVVVCEEIPEKTYAHITYILVPDSQSALGEVAACFYDYPSHKMMVTGVTGTNGKTSIATLLYRLFLGMGYKTGLISTISYCVNGKTFSATHTTPDALKIQQLMAEMADEGCEYCFMEVSSHAVHQKRISGIKFAGGIFTNITHDHLDYHKTFGEYLKAKKGFFDQLDNGAFALVNADDKNGMVMIQNTKAVKLTYSLGKMADYRCKVLESHLNGMLLNLAGREVWTRFSGSFNASNLLAVYATALILGQNEDEVLVGISNLEPVKGRFETIRSVGGKLGIVDYAHTPDALKNVLSAIAGIRSGNEQVITVVGAGGDRDRTKRPVMAKEALAGSDRVILTSDNPRTEDPEMIIKEMEDGILPEFRNRVVSIVNRREAIKTAVIMAKPGDIILIAGKGHENYQEIQGVKHHFDDMEVIREFFEMDSK